MHMWGRRVCMCGVPACMCVDTHLEVRNFQELAL